MDSIPNIINILETYKKLTKKVSNYILFSKEFKDIWDQNDLESFNIFIKDAEIYILDIVDHVNENKETYYLYRNTDLFNELVEILTDWKYILNENFELFSNNPGHILKIRKCINWIKRKD